MAEILTTAGIVDDTRLARTLGVEDRPDLIAVWVEWRLDGELVRRDAFPLPKEVGPVIGTIHGPMAIAELKRTIEVTDGPQDIAVCLVWRLGGELVRRDVNVISKSPSVVATAIAASVGG